MTLYKGEKVLKDAKSIFQQRFHWRHRYRIVTSLFLRKKEVKHRYTTIVNHTHITTQKQTNNSFLNTKKHPSYSQELYTKASRVHANPDSSETA